MANSDSEALAPPSRWQERTKAGAGAGYQRAGIFRLPGIRPVEGRVASIDRQIDAAEAKGLTEKVQKEELIRLLSPFQNRIMRGPDFHQFLEVAVKNFHRMFPHANKGVTEEHLGRVLEHAFGLLTDGVLEVHLVSSDPENLPPENRKWGFHAEPGEVKTETGEDASNLPFLVWQRGNRLYMKKEFFRHFSAMRPDESTIFGEVILHYPLEESGVAGRLGIAQNETHRFAYMIAECRRALEPVGDVLHEPGERHLDQWIMQFYAQNPKQMALFLRYHPGVLAMRWRLRALTLLLREEQSVVVYDVVAAILSREPDEDPDKAASDKLLLDALVARTKDDQQRDAVEEIMYMLLVSVEDLLNKSLKDPQDARRLFFAIAINKKLNEDEMEYLVKNCRNPENTYSVKRVSEYMREIYCALPLRDEGEVSSMRAAHGAAKESRGESAPARAVSKIYPQDFLELAGTLRERFKLMESNSMKGFAREEVLEYYTIVGHFLACLDMLAKSMDEGSELKIKVQKALVSRGAIESITKSLPGNIQSATHISLLYDCRRDVEEVNTMLLRLAQRAAMDNEQAAEGKVSQAL